MKHKKNIFKRVFAVFMIALTLTITLVTSVGATDSATEEDISNYEFVGSINEANTAVLGQPLYLRLWYNDTETNTRYYYLSLDSEVPEGAEGYLPVGYLGNGWNDLDGNGYYSDYTLAFEMRHDGSDSGYWYCPSVGKHDYVEIRISFRNINKEWFAPSDVYGLQATYLRYSGTEITGAPIYGQCGGVMLNKTRTWEYAIHCRFQYQGEWIGVVSRQYEYTPSIKVNNRPEYDEGVLDGYSSGYAKGYNAGIAIMEEYDLRSMITALVTAPVTFFKEAFSFELFGVNLAPFVLTLATLALVLFVVLIIFKFIP